MTTRLMICIIGAILAAQALLSGFPAFAEDAFIESGGVKIRYTDQGRGEPVVLLHGLLGTLEMNWEDTGIAAVLATDYRVIAIDLRGHGKSGKPHDPLSYGFDMVKDVLRVMNHLEIEKAHFLGYSLGATITVKLMVSFPERVASALLGGGGWTKPGNKADLEFVTQVADSLESGKGIGPVIRHMTPKGQKPPSDEEIAMINESITADNDVKAMACVFRGMPELFVAEELIRNNHLPCLALVGEKDPAKLSVDLLKKAKPGLKTVIIEGADHMSAIVHPELLEEVKAFLAEKR
ncbi:MAG: alpha/beta hydrolase [Planctomycetota bacterium]